MSYAYEQGDVCGDASKLAASLIPTMIDVSICNFSGPGQRMCSGGIPGFGLTNQKTAITYINGGKNADGIILAVGVNDWGAPEVGAIEFINTYRDFIRFCQAQGMKVVVSLPVWNNEELMRKPHVDGYCTLVEFRHYAAQVAYAEGANVFITDCIGLKAEHFVDGLHLNAKGHTVWASALVSQMGEWGLWP
nr:hypothetical protein [Pseudomonas putida]